VKDGAYAVLRPEFTQLGPILDISQGGLAFSYNLTGKPVNGSFELDIFLIGHGVLVERVPFRIVSDRKLIVKSQHNCLPRRRCGVRFGKLTHSQSQQMEQFMQHLIIPESGLRRLVGGSPFP
jgi:hypothetical protein